MPINVKVNLDGFRRKFSGENLRRGRLAMANDAQQAMEKYVPKRSGDLRKYSVVEHDGTSILYTQPYARAQFYGLINGHPVKNYSTPGTSKRWDLRLKGNTQDMALVKKAFLDGCKWQK